MSSTTYRFGGALSVLVLLVAACAPRPPVVTSPRFPDYPFPAVPEALAGTRSAERHAGAWRFLQAGDLRNAERSFNAIVVGNPQFYPAVAGLGFVELARQEHDGAIAHFDRALALAPAYVAALLGRGEARLVSAGEAEALHDFEAALVADPSLDAIRRRVEVLRFRQIQAAISKGRAAAAAGHLDEAREAYSRAIVASPESPTLHRELAIVERRAGDLDAALAYATKALGLDSTDAGAAVVLGHVHADRGDLLSAERAFFLAYELAPTEEARERLGDIRNRLLLARLPPEYRTIRSKPGITRGELAALVGVRLDGLLASVPTQPTGIVIDTRDHWAAPWVLTVMRAGVMRAYPNHTFQPNLTVRRDDLAQVVSRLLALIAPRDPDAASQWRAVRPVFSDLGPDHLSYAAASLAVSAGVLSALDNDSFQLARSVSGMEAVAAVDRLVALAAPAARP